MSAWVVEYEHIAAMVNAADRHARRTHSQFDWYTKSEAGETIRYTLSRTGVDQIEDAHTVKYPGSDHEYPYPAHVTVSFETLGGMLLAENVRSVGCCYNQSSPNDLPGSTVQDNTIYRHDGTIHLSPLAVLRAVKCYEYQSCEHAGWESSPAKSFCEALTDAMIRDLPGYDDLPWGFDASNVRGAAV